MRGIPDHELAAIFPLMGDEELRDLADDIEANGLRDPIWLLDGKILDGRNRYRACNLADVDPRIEEYRGKDPLGFVVSKNLHRRHLDAGQRAMVAARLAQRKIGENQHNEGEQICSPSLNEAAALLNVGRGSVVSAKAVLAHGSPELQAAVEKGEVSVSAAAEVAKLPKSEQKQTVKGGPKAVQRAAAQKREAKIERLAALGQIPDKKGTEEPGPATVPSKAISHAMEAINSLRLIRSYDPRRVEGFEKVHRWIQNALKGDPPDDFPAAVEAMCRELDGVVDRLKSLKALPLAFHIHFDSAIAQVQAARKTLWQGRPVHECPYCAANGEVRNDCNACHGLNRVKATTHKNGVEATQGVAR